VLVATLLQITPPGTEVAERPVLWRMRPEDLQQARTAIAGLLPLVAASAPDDGDAQNWPWELFGPMLTALPAELRTHLRDLSVAAAIKVETLEALTNPRTGEVVSGRPVLRLADGGAHRLSEWQIDVAFVAGERRLSTECTEVDGQIRYRYSIAKTGDRVLGLHLVSSSLAEVAFGTFTDELGVGTTSVDEKRSETPAAADAVAPGSPAEELEIESSGEGRADQGSVKADEVDLVPAQRDHPAQSRDPGSQVAEIRDARTPDQIMAQIRERQDRLWGDRRKRGSSLQRLALVQWDVADSYYAPGYGDGKQEGLRTLQGEVPTAKEVRAGGVFQSTAETRRRAILKEVLRACDQFRVDGLVVPEYSLRPETVNWLSRQLAQRNLSLTVWCGTFRVPDGTAISTSIPTSGISPYFQPVSSDPAGAMPWESHSAMLTCIDAIASRGKTQISSYMRRKRYPSAAAGELIRPGAQEPWKPLLADERDPFRLGTYTIDLVCSEMFLHASSSNFIGILEENRSLALRYAVPWSDADAINSLNQDMHVFARWTSYRSIEEPTELARGARMQRTVMILPAMTSRSADYHIFGQNQYLASGLVTAFCNAVEPTSGCGGSAFVGLDGWKAGSEIATPYGSLAPGIYQIGDKHSGPLGDREAAMVIVDIDPIRTTDLKPRPHYQSRSLQLVAHLPLIFSTEVDTAPAAHGTRNRKPRKRAVRGTELHFLEATRAVLEVLEAPDSWRDERAAAATDPSTQAKREAILQKTVAALEMLPLFADDPGWLRRRATAFRDKRWLYSPPIFLPALTDWLFIEDGWQKLVVDSAGKHPLEADEDILDVPRDCSISNFEG
jgi:hypothetical protein